MSSTTAERQNGSMSDVSDLKLEIEELKKEQAVQAATDAGAHATQAAVTAGGMATQTAAQAGIVMTMVTGSVALVVGMLLGSLFTRS
jgi:hypothetical protein